MKANGSPFTHVRVVLFHNGTWSDWRENLRRMPRHRIPDGLLSDTRVAASLVDLCGTDVLDRLPGRWVFFDRDFTELYGDWREWGGMKASNLHFPPVQSDRPSRSPRPFLKFSATCAVPRIPGTAASDPTNETMNQQTELMIWDQLKARAKRQGRAS